MQLWNNDKELFLIIQKELFTALVGDALDRLGCLHQFLPPEIKPLSPGMVVIGRALPVIEADIDEEIPEKAILSPQRKPFGLMFDALDDLKENEVYICSGSANPYALWGGLMSTRAMKLKAAGAVVNGYSRDSAEILRLGFPVFSAGSYAQDQGPRGQVVDFRVPLTWNGIRIKPGDIVFGDRDGVVIVPSDAVTEVFTGALEKARGEKTVLKALQEGMSAADAFRLYGIM